MEISMIYLLLSLLFVVVLRRTYRLIINYLQARKLGIHIIVVPVAWHEEWWLLIGKAFKWLDRVPVLGYWYKYSYLGWPISLRYKPHELYGDAFMIVSPKRNILMVNDPAACTVLQRDYKTWIKPQSLYKVFDTFGKGLISVNGEDWQRHRRIVNPAFREPNNKLVWEESLRQVNSMLDIRGSSEKGPAVATLAQMKADCLLIAMHVLSAAGFGHMHDFDSGLQERPEGKTRSFSDALAYLIVNGLSVILLGNLKLPRWLTWPKLRELQNAMGEFHMYLNESIAYTRATTQNGSGGLVADIASTLIQANETARTQEKPGGNLHAHGHLSDDEVLGNLYNFNVAGFETTAGTLSYAIPFLAVNQQVQDWARDQIDAVFADAVDGPDYETSFPKLTRCLAIMYETLRLWGPLPDTARLPASDRQMLCVGGHEIFIPEGTFVSTNFYALHTDPRWWGSGNMEWSPKRWITKDNESGLEAIASPPAGGAFLAWSSGPRICPGKKFSQVEFVAVIASLLHKFRLEPLVMRDKGMTTQEDAAQALMKTIKNSEMMTTPKMLNPEAAGITLVRR